MSNPSVPTAASLVSANFIAQGATTIVWGTQGLYSTWIVVSASDSERVEEIDIENGTGFEALVILLNKGVDVNFEVIDDTAITPPTIGSITTLSTPFGSIPMLAVGGAASGARKREGMRTFAFKSYNAILGLH